MKHISLLGATGSIGTQTLDVIRQHPEQFKLSSLSFGRNINLGREIISEFSPKVVSCSSKEDCERLRIEFPTTRFVYGIEGLEEVATLDEVDIVVTAVMGSVGLSPTLKAIEAKKDLAIANKETLVTAGHLVMEKAREMGVHVLPVDSEHSAIFQCLQGERYDDIDEIILTASGGSFRDYSRADLINVTVEDALNHPNWSMGAKITIDSATMMNKGLEVIEAHWLFNVSFDKIKVLLHKESIIHSMVQFKDTSVIAQLGNPDMRVPIQYALTYPSREVLNATPLNLAKIHALHFSELDFARFPCIQYAFEAGRTGGTLPTVLNAANEIAVDAFLQKKITFLQIEELIYQAMANHQTIQKPDLQTINNTDEWARNYVRSLIR